MKRILSAVMLMFVLAGSAFGLSDSEYRKMRNNSRAFREADNFLTEAYNALKETMPRSEFNGVQEQQREWIKSGRDEAAETYIEEGLSRIEAYTQATEDRAEELDRQLKMQMLPD